jgi:predicted amidohydrolase YtcJ
MNSNPHSRRNFLKIAAASSAATYFLGERRMVGQTPNTTSKADSIITNGRIATLDSRRPFVSAVAITNGRFIATGNDKEIMAYRDSNTRVIDLKGRTAIPGLNDSHTHLIRGGLNYNLELRWMAFHL